jgi:hypothetical protein
MMPVILKLINNNSQWFQQRGTRYFENFQFDKIIARLIKNKLLHEMIDAILQNRYVQYDKIDNHDMGYVFEGAHSVSQTNQMKPQESILHP